MTEIPQNQEQKIDYGKAIREFWEEKVDWEDEEESISRGQRYNNLMKVMALGGKPIALATFESVQKEDIEIPIDSEKAQQLERLKALESTIIKAMNNAEINQKEAKEFCEKINSQNPDKNDYYFIQNFAEKTEAVYQELLAENYTPEEIRG